MEFLKIENLCKTYGSGENQVKALDDISFTVPKGQMTAVIGASGSGKSTLLHILGAVDSPTSGKVWLDGQDVFAQNQKNLAVFRRRQVGLIYQFYNLIPVLNAEENMTLPMLMDGRKPDPAQVEEMLSLMGLSERRKHLPSQLSGGQQQRVSIGRALFTSPAVLLADEPTGNLDSKNSMEIMTLLRKSNQERRQTMLIITHDENIALQCDRILTLSDGKIIQDVMTGQGA
ncbi:MAG: ABC transporter ATP-binding protein [Oscillospiraceae bacterium]|nr:ABC transporter ATP-binding protein [Oscillospiraceae bacterium]